MNDKINQIMRKTYAYWWVDGMADLALGLFFLVLSGYNYLLVTLPLSDALRVILSIAQPLVFIGCWVLYGRLVRWVKQHITYRRTGYVAFAVRKKKNKVARAVVGALMGVFTALMVTVIGPKVLKINSLIIIGGVMALVSLYLGYWYGILRLYVLAALELGLGFWLSTWQMDGELLSIYLMALIGAGWFLSGLVTFIVYLLRSKPAADEMEDV